MGVRKHGTIRNRYLATLSVLALRNAAGLKLLQERLGVLAATCAARQRLPLRTSAIRTALLYIITQLCENCASLWICILFYAILTGNGGSIGILF